ncbi:hypothetical protein ILYODFUR_015984 [Ilyodon furcidens]|uniref:Uncharacterized protein n=1 Tax=Ilyodon furcidens TaxID=33524 RepID=A0ABV0SLL2_9TELE
MSLMDVSLANILLSPTTSTESGGQPRTGLALLTSLFSLPLSTGYHRVIKSPEQRPAHPEGTQSPQKVEATLALLLWGIGVMGPVQFTVDVNSRVLKTVNCLKVLPLDVHWCVRWCPSLEVYQHLLRLTGVQAQMVALTPVHKVHDD